MYAAKIANRINLQGLSSAPVSGVEGDVYYDSVDHKYYVWNGSVWFPVFG